MQQDDQEELQTLKDSQPQDKPTTDQEGQSDAERAEEYLDLLRRTQANFINYRRRVQQEQEALRTSAQSELFVHLFPVIDDLERAIVAIPEALIDDPWVTGVSLIAQRLMTQLEQLGVQPIGRPGDRFDPYLHEAVTTEINPDVPDGTISQVLRVGYIFKDRVIRPAQVIVSRT